MEKKTLQKWWEERPKMVTIIIIIIVIVLICIILYLYNRGNSGQDNSKLDKLIEKINTGNYD